jgi:transposase-like protein
VRFLVDRGVILDSKPCLTYGRDAKLHLSRMKYRCNRAGCRLEFSARDGTFFVNSRVPCNKLLMLALLWLSKSPHGSIVSNAGLAKNTVTEYLNHFRQLVADSLNENEITIGGDNVIVEIDETKLGKRKYHRGHRVDGVWIIGGVERTQERRIFLSIVEDRSAGSLLDVISNRVLPGSIIYTDLWKGYGGLERMGFQHMTVNHSKTFVDPETGVCTNTIEGTWAGLKMSISPRARTSSCDLQLWEFIG